jgi:hypothetical protein
VICWVSVTGNFFFSFYLVTKITNVNNRKSQTKVQKNFFHKISTLKWMFMALNLSLSIIIFFKSNGEGMYHHSIFIQFKWIDLFAAR